MSILYSQVAKIVTFLKLQRMQGNRVRKITKKCLSLRRKMPFFDQKRQVFDRNLVHKQYFTFHIQFYKRSKICNKSIVSPRNQMLQILGSDCIITVRGVNSRYRVIVLTEWNYLGYTGKYCKKRLKNSRRKIKELRIE